MTIDLDAIRARDAEADRCQRCFLRVSAVIHCDTAEEFITYLAIPSDGSEDFSEGRHAFVPGGTSERDPRHEWAVSDRNDLLALYDKLRAEKGRFDESVCAAARAEVIAQAIDAVRRLPATSVLVGQWAVAAVVQVDVIVALEKLGLPSTPGNRS